MRVSRCCMIAVLCFALMSLFISGCRSVQSPDVVLKSASAVFETKESVSIPLLRCSIEFPVQEKKKSYALSAQIISQWPDKLRMKVTKANYHLVSMIINGHEASLYFPRTNKVFETALHQPLLEKGQQVDILAEVIDLFLVFLKGPFPEYPLGKYSYKGEDEGLFVYTADTAGGAIKLFLDPVMFRVKRRRHTFAGGDKDRIIEIDFDHYKRSARTDYPHKITVSVYEAEQENKRITIEMFVSRLSFNAKVSEKAFQKQWPEDALIIKHLPEKAEELFGTIDDEE